jgi:hypothetical protein
MFKPVWGAKYRSMKKIMMITLNFLMLTLLLSGALFWVYFYDYHSIAKSEGPSSYHFVPFVDCIPLALFYILSISITFLIIVYSVKKIFKVFESLYLIGFLSAGTVIVIFKFGSGTQRFSSLEESIDVIVVLIFGLLIADIFRRKIFIK